MEQSLTLYLQIFSVTVSLILLLLTFIWPSVGRFLLVLLFLWASYINAETAITNPQDYLNYSSLVWFDLYRDFIDGYFSRNITLIIVLIAFFQLIIAILFATKGKPVKWSGWAIIAFLLAVAPLGVGSGFPSTLIMALAVFIIIRKPVDRSLWEMVFRKKFNGQA